ncbi:ParB N-terminal domain-containing protein [Fibrella sp. WM1]|uniref:ParB N-terminal domain-containing protein n=1 Tax=Fibrella musci TaxID=3242485 RepID=UPI003521A4D3
MLEKLAWTTQQRKVVDLLPYEYNPRKMTAQQSRKLRESLEKFGLVEIPVINADGVLLAGHQRCKAMVALGRGDELVDVRVPNRQLTDAEFKEYNVASNAIKGDWVDELLREHFAEVDLADFGISLADVEQLHEQTSAKADVPELPIVAKFSEQYSAVVIICTNAIDANHVAEVLQLSEAKSYKSDRVGRTSVIHAKQFIDAWKAAKS